MSYFPNSSANASSIIGDTNTYSHFSPVDPTIKGALEGIDSALAALGTGSVTNFSFVNSNGFVGSITNPTTTPQLTVGISVTGLLKGSSSAIVAATAADLPLSVDGGADPLAYNSATGQFSMPAAAMGQNGYLLGSDWSTFSAKANSSLNNLTFTAINQHLFPDGPGTQALGGAINYWAPSYISALKDTSDVVSVNLFSRSLVDSAGVGQLLWSTAGVSIGQPGSVAGVLGVANGTASASVFIKASNVLSSFNFNLPAAAGSAGQVLTSGGGGSNPMTWTNPVTSVGLADGSAVPIYSISNSPVITTGTLTFTLNNQSANTVFAGPSTGSPAQPGFRSLVLNDIPSLSSLYLPLTGSTMAGNIDMASTYRITNVPNGVAAGDAVNKAQLDAITAGILWLAPLQDPDLIDDSLSTPPGSPVASAVYIIGAAPTGAWSTIGAGHAVWYNTATSTWVDMLGRAVQSGDRFGVTFEVGSGSEGGGLVGKHNYLAVVNSPTPGSITYNFSAPVANWAVFVNQANSDHFGHSYDYNGTQWVEFSGPAAIPAGTALAYSGNTLNVQIDNSTISTNLSNQLQIKDNGVTNAKLAQMGAYTLKANNTGATANASDVSIGNLTETVSSVLTITGGSHAIIGNVTIQVTQASGSASGYLSSTDWTTFNNKQNALTFGNLTDIGTDGITITGGTGAVIGTGTSISQHVADTTHNGYLSSTDWNTFNNKQPAGNYITALTGDVTATGPGSATATIPANQITNAKLAQMAANTIKGNNTGVTANASDLSISQVLTMLGIRAGTVSLGSGASSGSATFSTAFASTSYAISVVLVNTTDANPLFQPITITAQSTTGFTFKLNDPTDTANYSVQYIAIGNN